MYSIVANLKLVGGELPLVVIDGSNLVALLASWSVLVEHQVFVLAYHLLD